MKKKIEFASLMTPFEKDICEVPFSEYPRPAFKRDSYICLNGKWGFTVCKKNGKKTTDILVPFPPQSRISGAEYETDPSDTLIYKRSFSLPEGFNKGRVLLHFGAVDQHAEVYVNGKKAGSHSGGYLPFSFDITELLSVAGSMNELEVRCVDGMDRDLPYGNSE